MMCSTAGTLAVSCAAVRLTIPGHVISVSLLPRSGAGVQISEAFLDADRVESPAAYIIIVEKHTVFQRLCEDQLWHVLPCILVTGRGFPDLATGGLVQRLCAILNIEVPSCQQLVATSTRRGSTGTSTRPFPRLSTRCPSFCANVQCGYLGDFDPPGISIFLSYYKQVKARRDIPDVRRSGDVWQDIEGDALLQKPLLMTQKRNCLHWIGMSPEDIGVLVPANALLALSTRDRSVLRGLLEHPVVQRMPRLESYCKYMVERDAKFEIEAVYTNGFDFLARRYIPQRVLRRTWL